MTWTAPRTWATGEVLTAALLNAHLRDDLLETAPAKVTTAGDTVYGSGANALARLAIGRYGQLLRPNASTSAPEWFTPPSVRARHGVNQSVSHDTVTALALSDKLYDTDGMRDTATNNARIKINTPGVYGITGHVRFAANSSGRRDVRIMKNSTTILAASETMALTDGNPHLLNVATIAYLATTEYLELCVIQGSGGSLNVETAANYSPEIAVTWMGATAT